MPIRASQVLDYLDTHPVSLYEGDFPTLLEMLHHIYTEANNLDTEKIRRLYRRADTILEKLPADDNNQLFSLICDLCLEHERTAFSHGISVGMHLMTELNALP